MKQHLQQAFEAGTFTEAGFRSNSNQIEAHFQSIFLRDVDRCATSVL